MAQIAMLDEQIKLHRGAILGLEESKGLLLQRAKAMEAVANASKAAEESQEKASA